MLAKRIRKGSVRPIEVSGETAKVTLTKGYVAIIDAEDVDLVSSFNWHAIVIRNTVYACRRYSSGDVKKAILMHREIAKTPDDMFTDHIDGNGLNNRKSNLRSCTHAQNQYNQKKSSKNTSGHKGVYFDRNRWMSAIVVNGKFKNLGRFLEKSDAVKAYSLAAQKYFGEFSRLE